MKAATDTAWEVRLVTARALGELPPDGRGRTAIRGAVLRLLGDEHAQVRAAAAIAAGRLGRRGGDDPAVVATLVAMAAADIEGDPTLRHAVVMGFAGAAPGDEIARLAGHDAQGVRLAACLALRRIGDPRIARCLNDASERVALEAARAIHDLPIDAALPALAAKAASGPAADPFLRRAISAAERVGTADAAIAVVRLVGRPDVPTPLRVMALDALRTWEAPAAKNRVTNVWRPITTPRTTALARAALEPAVPQLLADGAGRTSLDEPTRAALLATASAIGIKEVAPLLVAWCRDARSSPASRVKAFESLVAAGDPAVREIATAFITDPQPLVRTAARTLRAATLPPAETVPELVAAIGSRDLAERQAAVTVLGGLDADAARDAVAVFAARLEAGSLDPTIELEVREAIANRLGTAKAEAVAAARSKPDDPLAAWQDVMTGGDAARGHAVFLTKTEVSCIRCHRAGKQGGDVGPGLDGIARTRDRRHLLESLVLPDAKVEEKFRTTVVVTDAGTTVAGIVVSESAANLALKNAEGKVITIPVKSIETRTSGPSAMPADLAGKLTRRELRDLLEWLSSLK